MKKLLVAVLTFIASVVLAESQTLQNIKVVEGQGLHYINVSLKDISRVTCPSEIGEPFYSKEKEMEVLKHNKDLFVKILPKQVTYSTGKTSIEYNEMPREMYVECGGQFFTFVLSPKNIPAQQIVIQMPYADLQESIVTESASDYEHVVMDLIKSAYNEITPSGYKVATQKEIRTFREAQLTKQKVYTGFRYIVEDWVIRSKLSVEKEFDENAFIPLFKDVRAISIVNPLIAPDGTSRMLVVRYNSSEQK